MEKRKDRIKALVSTIIWENKIICDVINDTKDRPFGSFIVQIKNEKNSCASRKNFDVILGVGNLEKLYNLCDTFCNTYKLNFSIDSNVFQEKRLEGVCIENCSLCEEDLYNLNLLNEDTIGSSAALTIYAFAFTLYHEFGHVKNNDDTKPQIENERKADLFAMKVVNEMCLSHQEIDISKSPFFLGALLETSLMLEVSDPWLTLVDTSHPHPIERLYCLLEFFHMENDSYLWDYVYNLVICWANKNSIAITYEKSGSKTVKDKFLDAYHRFKK